MFCLYGNRCSNKKLCKICKEEDATGNKKWPTNRKTYMNEWRGEFYKKFKKEGFVYMVDVTPEEIVEFFKNKMEENNIHFRY